MLFASHRTCFPDLDRLSQFVPQLTLPFSPTAILFSHSLLLYDIDFIHNSLPPILGPRPRWVSVSLCIKSQSSSYLSHGGWARTTNCLGVCSCESVSHSLWLSLLSHTDFSQSITPPVSKASTLHFTVGKQSQYCYKTHSLTIINEHK